MITSTDPAPSATGRRLEAGGLVGFNAPPALGADLQRVLVDLVELHLQAKQAHWNVVGANFRDLHLQLDDITQLAREGSDTIAERLRALRVPADGRSDTVATTTTLAAMPAGEIPTHEAVEIVTQRLRAVSSTIRVVLSRVDETDPVSGDLLHSLAAGLEKQAWMLAAEHGPLG